MSLCVKSTLFCQKSPICTSAWPPSGGIFDYERKAERLIEVQHELAEPNVWNNPERAQALGKERADLERIVHTVRKIEDGLKDASELLSLAEGEGDSATIQSVATDVETYEKQVGDLEFRRMFPGEVDPNNAFLEIQSGAGDTEAQDWAEMMLRMYLQWGNKHGFHTELNEVSPGEVAGIKSATVRFEGPYAYGWLRTETGVHRLVRKSPFDSNNRRHTSFASVFVSPEVDDTIEIEINPADLRTDTYRSSGAGGQHVNKTDSAVRITHLPTKTVVQCQNQRSQHKNRDLAMKQLRAKLYELEMQKRNAEKQKQEDNKADIGWGSQIRSYVLDQSRVKD